MVDGDAASAVRGDADSFIQLYRTHVQSIYRYLLARLGNRQDAEDVTAQVFERAWTSLPRYQPKGTFRGWLFTIAQRTLVDHYRRPQPIATSIDGLSDIVLDAEIGPEDSAVASDQVRQVWRIVQSLKQEQQEVIALRFTAELAYGEVAQITGKSESAVKMIAYRALEEIRRRYPDVKP